MTAGVLATAAAGDRCRCSQATAAAATLRLRARRGVAAGFFLLGRAARCFSRWSTFSIRAEELEITKRVSNRSSSALVAWRTGGDYRDCQVFERHVLDGLAVDSRRIESLNQRYQASSSWTPATFSPLPFPPPLLDASLPPRRRLISSLLQVRTETEPTPSPCPVLLRPPLRSTGAGLVGGEKASGLAGDRGRVRRREPARPPAGRRVRRGSRERERGDGGLLHLGT